MVDVEGLAYTVVKASPVYAIEAAASVNRLVVGDHTTSEILVPVIKTLSIAQ